MLNNVQLRKPSAKRTFLLAALVCVGDCGVAHSDDLSDCVMRPTSFSGVVPLSYSTVIGEQASKLLIHPAYPANCGPRGGMECKSTGYLVAGDTVAVSKTCGKWAYSQYVGQKHVTVGWIDSSRLGATHTPPRRPALTTWNYKQPTFKLLSGRGVPVCEAYLQRLNQSSFERTAYCGRPENDDVPGFTRLGSTWMTPEEFTRLFVDVESFLNQDRRENYFVARQLPDGSKYFGPPTDYVWKPPFMPSIRLYDPEVDIDNDGIADPIALWTIDDREQSQCGVTTDTGFRARTSTVGIVLTPNRKSIDQSKTQALFGRELNQVHTILGRTSHNYLAVGTSVDVFRYRGTYYVDTFYEDNGNGDFYGQRRKDPKLANTLGVLLRESGKTRLVCEYVVDEHQ